MHKKIAFIVVNLVLFVTPLSVSAQLITLPTVPQNASVQQLQDLIQQLTQILNQLLAIRYPTASNTTFDALPKAGLSPLTVVFTSSSSGGVIDFGDGQTAPMSLAQCSQGATMGAFQQCSLSHLYTSTGTYRAKLSLPSCVGYACPQAIAGAITITVIAGSSSDTCANTTNKSPVCSSGSHLVGAQVFGGCKIGGQCVSDATSPTTSSPSCSVSYSPSTIDRTQTLGIAWSGVGTTRSFFMRKTATGQTFGTSTIAVNGVQQDTSFRTLDYGTYVRTDTVSNTVGTATCSTTLTIVATSSTPTVCPVYQQLQCPTGQHVTNTGNTTSANGCTVPHYACVADSPSASCTAADGRVYLTGQSATYSDWCPPRTGSVYCGSGTKVCQGGVWVSAGDGSTPPSPGSGTGTCTFSGNTTAVTSAFGCSSWCSSFYGIRLSELGEGVLPLGGTCVYRDANGNSQVVAVSSDSGTNFASALAAFIAALKAFLAK